MLRVATGRYRALSRHAIPVDLSATDARFGQAAVFFEVLHQLDGGAVLSLNEPAFQGDQKTVDGVIAEILRDFLKRFGERVSALLCRQRACDMRCASSHDRGVKGLEFDVEGATGRLLRLGLSGLLLMLTDMRVSPECGSPGRGAILPACLALIL
jgi:hypothetical protein